MKIINNFNEFIIKESVSVALGYFDGVHLGHTQVIKLAKEKNSKLVVFSFVFNNENNENKKSRNLINTFNDKAKILEGLGVDYFIAPNFNEIKNIEALEFLEILKNKMNISKIACGKDFKFGKDAKGNIEVLEKFSKKNNIKINVANEYKYADEVISSSSIRKHILSGEIEKANTLLGRVYSYNAKVNYGKQLGRKLNFPTINQFFAHNQIIPKYGVYASIVDYQGKLYAGATNIGIKPTVEVDIPDSETNIFGYNGDLYGKKVRIGLIKYIRTEKKFTSMKELKKQISIDILSINDICDDWFQNNINIKTLI